MGARVSRAAVAMLCCALLASACASSSKPGASGGGTGGNGSSGPTPPANSRFTGDKVYCTPPPADAPAPQPKAIDRGLTADSVVVTHVRLDTSLIKVLGFAYDYGNAVDQVHTFVNYLNDKCGGVNGRKLVVHDLLQPVPGLGGDPQLEAQRSCTKIDADWDSVAAFSYTGVGDPLAQCVTGPHQVIYIGTYDFGQQDFDQSQGRLFSFNHAPTSILTYAASELAPKLKGKKVFVVTDDAAPDPEVVQEGLMKALKDQGVDAQLDVLRCGDDPRCATGMIPSVQRLIAAKSNVVFPLLSTLALPAYLDEMVTQGVKPGQVAFYNTSFQAQDSELVASHIPTAGSKKAAELYNGATIVAGGREGEFRTPGYKPDPFAQMCNDTYVQNSKVVRKQYDPRDDNGSRLFNVVSGACAMVRLIARALESAGPNPTRAQIAAAMGNLGKIDALGVPSTLVPGKPTAPDAIAVASFNYPCPLKVSTDMNGVCMIPKTEYLPIPKG